MIFKDENAAMVKLGVGKNMVKSIRFWAEVAGVLELGPKGGHKITRFGHEVLGHDGHDPFIQRQETLWLLHWKIAANPWQPFFHWQQMLNFWHRNEFSASEVMPFLKRGLPANVKMRSPRTIADGFRVFVASYVPPRVRKGEIAEDTLDCPLVELGLIRANGERPAAGEIARETIYTFHMEDKSTVTPAVFAWALAEFWRNRYPQEHSIPFQLISTGEGSPGQIFKLPELAVRKRLDELSAITNGALTFTDSRSLPSAVRKDLPEEEFFLDAIFSEAA